VNRPVMGGALCGREVLPRARAFCLLPVYVLTASNRKPPYKAREDPPYQTARPEDLHRHAPWCGAISPMAIRIDGVPPIMAWAIGREAERFIVAGESHVLVDLRLR